MKIAVLLADAFQDSEYFLRKYELERAGARTEVISLHSKPVEIYSNFLGSACLTSTKRSAMRIRSPMPACWFPVAQRAR
jgi:putative intracellular protease/amidase